MLNTKPTIIFVDDEDIILKTLKRCLIDKQEEWVSIYTSSPERALELCKTELVDLVVTDMRMPVMNGLELAEQIRKSSKKTRIMLLTGYAGLLPDDVSTLVDGVLTKPIDRDLLISSVNGAVGR